MTAASQSTSQAAAGTVELGLLDDIVAKSKVAKTSTEHNRAKDIIGELVKEVSRDSVH